MRWKKWPASALDYSRFFNNRLTMPTAPKPDPKKYAARLRRMANELDPPAPKAKVATKPKPAAKKKPAKAKPKTK